MNYHHRPSFYELGSSYTSMPSYKLYSQAPVEESNQGESSRTEKEENARRWHPLRSRTLITVVVLGLLLFVGTRTLASPANDPIILSDAAENWEAIHAAIDALNNEDYDLALEELDSLLNIDTDFAGGYVLASHIYLLQGDADIAAVLAHTAYLIDSEDAAAYFFAGEALCEIGQYEDAQAHYQAYRDIVGFDSEPVLLALLDIDSQTVLATRSSLCTQHPLVWDYEVASAD